MNHRKNNRFPGLARAAASIEALEPRRLLAVTFNATAGDDNIAIGINGNVAHVSINGVDHTTMDLGITVNAGGGNDLIQIVATPIGSNVVIHGEGGNDTLQNIGGDLHSSFRGSFLFDGGDGSDQVIADNSNDPTANATFTIQGDAIVGPTGTFFRYQTAENFDYEDSGSSNRLEFINLDNLQRVVIDGNGGDDSFVNHSAVPTGYFPTSLPGLELDIRGGAGNDSLALDDEGDPFAEYTLVANNLFYDSPFSNARTVNYNTIESFDLVETNGPDLTALNGKAPETSMTIETMGGDDSVTVGGGNFDSSGLGVANTIFGGSGTNSIRFDDHLNTAGEIYTFNNFTLGAGTGGVTYGGFATQTLDLADGALSAKFKPTNNVNINALSSQIESTTINGGPTHVALVNVGNGLLTQLAGTINLLLNGVGGTVNFNDQSDTTARTLQLSASQFSGILPVNFSGASAVNLNAGSGSDSISVTGSAPGTSVAVHGNNGNETFQIGGGNFANLAGNVSVTGDAGNDTIQYLDTSSTSHDSATLTGAALLTGGRTLGYATVEHLGITMGSGGSLVSLDSVGLLTTVTGGAGDDVVSIGNGSLNNNFTANIQFDGGAGTDTMNLLGQNDTAKNTYAFPRFDQFRFGDTSTGKFVVFSGVEQGSLQCGSGDDTIDASIVTFALSIFAGAGNDGVTVTASTALVTVDTGSEHSAPLGFPGSDGITVGFVATAATVLIPQSDTVGSLSVAADCTLRIGPGAVLRRVLSSFIDFGLGLGGTIDLAGGALIWGATSNMPDFRTYLTRGYNGGAWNGTNSSGAINSSLATSTSTSDSVGYGLGSQIAPTTIGPFSIAPGDMVLRYTLDGDANLDHAVDSADFNVLAANFGQTGRIWSQADFNYDSATDTTDFNALASNFSKTLPAPAAASASVGVAPSRTSGHQSPATTLFNSEVKVCDSEQGPAAFPTDA